MATRLAVFDCDGTLADGQAAICKKMEAAFAEVGLTAPPRTAIRRIIGLSLPEAMQRLAPDAGKTEQAMVVEAYKAGFRASRLSGSLSEPLFEGISAMLHRLHEGGWQMGVATGKSMRGLMGLLEANGLGPLFSTLHTADFHPSKPHPEMLHEAMAAIGAAPHQTVMIGDTVYDIEMAVAAGTRAIGVAWGYHERRELIAAGAQAVAETPEQLEQLINE